MTVGKGLGTSGSEINAVHTRSASLEAVKIVLKPSDINDIEMVRRLVQEQNVSFEEHGPGQCEFHLPTT